MDWVLLIKGMAAFAFVLGLMFLFSWLLKKMGLAGQGMPVSGKKRLSVVEFMPLDHRRRLVLLRCDQKEHLVILGPQGETVIDKDIPVTEFKA